MLGWSYSEPSEVPALPAAMALAPTALLSSSRGAPSVGLAAVRATGFHAPVSPLHRPPLEQLIDGPAGPIRLRIIQPAATTRAVILSIHGGGWCIGSPEEDDA
jgi:acetyl esterase/lipase